MRWRGAAALLLAASLVAAGCGPDEKTPDELAQEAERALEQQRRALGQPVTPVQTLAYFMPDAAQGSLAGLLPGDLLAQARNRYGSANTTRAWASGPMPITQYEWELAGGITLRVNADPVGQIVRIAVLPAETTAAKIPTLANVVLGEDTFTTLQQKFAGRLSTHLQLWGAGGHYTISQTALTPQNPAWRLQFAYELPANLPASARDQVYEHVHKLKRSEIVEPYLRGRRPYLVALEVAPESAALK